MYCLDFGICFNLTSVPIASNKLLPCETLYIQRSSISQLFRRKATNPPIFSDIKLNQKSSALLHFMSRRSGTWVRCSLVTFAIVSALCVCGPALYWRFNKSVRLTDSATCAPCRCNCPEPISLLQLPGLVNLSVTDCGGNDPELKSEMEKQFVDLLTEELKLHEMVSEEQARHMNITFLEAKRAASQYQKEAEKCNSSTEICEGARERTEALLTKERKTTLLWEKRARNMGWTGE